MCVKENYTSEVLFICVFIALLWGAGNMNTTRRKMDNISALRELIKV